MTELLEIFNQGYKDMALIAGMVASLAICQSTDTQHTIIEYIMEQQSV